jgi:hypothetical protein
MGNILANSNDAEVVIWSLATDPILTTMYPVMGAIASTNQIKKFVTLNI